MRVIVLIKATDESEAGIMPPTGLIEAMGNYSRELVEVGIKRSPNPMPDPSKIEIRPLFEVADFAEAMTPEQADEEERMREEMEVNGRVPVQTVMTKSSIRADWCHP